MKQAEIELKDSGKAETSTIESKAANVPKITELTEEEAKALALKQREFPNGVIPERLMEFIKLFEEHTPSHRDYLTAGLLMAISTVAAGKFGCRNRVSVAINTGEKSTPCNLFLLIVGRTSKGKSVGLDKFMNPLEKLDSEMAKEYQSAIVEWERQQAAIKGRKKGEGEEEQQPMERPMETRYFTDDFTLSALKTRLLGNSFKNQCLTAFKEEFDQFIDQTKRGAAEHGTLAQFLTLWNGKRWATMRKDSSENGKFNSGTIDIENPIFGFVGGLQPELLERFANGKNQDSGFVGRFNVFYPKDAKKKAGRIATEEEAKAVQIVSEHWESMIRSVHNYSPGGKQRKTILHFNDQANKEYQRYCQEFAETMNILESQGELKLCKAWGKYDEHVVRYSLIVYIADLMNGLVVGGKDIDGKLEIPEFIPSGQITAEQFQRAEKLCNYFKQQIMDVITMEGESKLEGFPPNIRDWYNSLPNEFPRSIFTSFAIPEHGQNLIKYDIGRPNGGKLCRLLADKRLFRKEAFKGGNYVKIA